MGIIYLNRQDKLNALNSDIIDDLSYLIDALEEDGEVRVIVIKESRKRDSLPVAGCFSNILPNCCSAILPGGLFIS